MTGAMLGGFILCWEMNRNALDHPVRHALVLRGSHGRCRGDAQCEDKTDGEVWGRVLAQRSGWDKRGSGVSVALS